MANGLEELWVAHVDRLCDDAAAVTFVAPGFVLLVEMDPKDDLRISRMVQIRMNVPHGLDFHDGSFYVIDGADRLVAIDDLRGTVALRNGDRGATPAHAARARAGAGPGSG